MECNLDGDCVGKDKICHENKCICARDRPIEDQDRCLPRKYNFIYCHLYELAQQTGTTTTLFFLFFARNFFPSLRFSLFIVNKYSKSFELEDCFVIHVRISFQSEIKLKSNSLNSLRRPH